MAKVYLSILLLFVCFPAFSDTYIKAEIGGVYYNPGTDGLWRQDRHPHYYDWWAPSYGLGIGYRADNLNLPHGT